MGSEGQTPLQVGRRAHLRHVSRPDPATGTQVPAHHAPVEEARIRVVQLVATGSGGGAQEHVATLLAHLDRARFEVRVISLSDGSAVSRWRASGVETEVLSVTDEGRLGHEVAARLADWRTQVVHGHMYLAELVGARAVRTLEVQGLPRPFLVNHIHSSRTRSTDDRERLTDLDPWVDHLIAVSEAIRAKLAAERPRRPRVSLIPNGVDTDRFHPAHGRGALSASLAIPPSARVVGCVARLEPEKGHETLLDAWPRVLEQIPDARLLIIGEGSLDMTLRQRATSLGLHWRSAADTPATASSRVAASASSAAASLVAASVHDRPAASIAFLGHRDDMPALTAALDVSVLPSRREAQGLAILEAMAVGRPVVATRVGGIPEMVRDGVSGLLVPSNDPVALAAAIVRLLQDRPLAQRLGVAGRELVRRHYQAEGMVSAISSVYEQGAATWAWRARAVGQGSGGAAGVLAQDEGAAA